MSVVESLASECYGHAECLSTMQVEGRPDDTTAIVITALDSTWVRVCGKTRVLLNLHTK